ncbi:zinc-binding dehydrogenase [Agromyces sp. CFH 90414]|uniref:Zinc-binding dehydrogenase n=2 Tax=Agromyces agglutinans TaxID=2662258 RepID=A0A6I2FDY6_9MICO|nr:zinc-binding dehydrogenase [Agromyces agglutinans]
MRAAVFDRYGPPEVLRIAMVPKPRPAAGEVLVRVLTTSLNGGEVEARAGRLSAVLGQNFPMRTGVDLVGEIVEVAGDVRDVQVGQVVWATSESPPGTAAEYVAVRRGRLSLSPTTLTAAQAVTMPVGATTALTALRDKVAIKAGERLLVRGATGGVGSFAVQIGNLQGAHVTALARAEALETARALGADEAIDCRSTPLSALGRFDVILDTAGTDLRAQRRLLNTGGRMVTITIDMNRRLASLAYLLGSTIHGSRRVRIFRGDPDTELMTEVAMLADRSVLRPIVNEVYPLDRIADAHRSLEAGGVIGKHVIEIAKPSVVG